MAEKTSPARPPEEVDELAFQIFAQRMASLPGKRGGEPEALDAFRQAEAFLAVRGRVRSGEAKKAAEEPVLADCCAPNLRRTHPHNLVSQRLGDLAKVNRVKQWLDRNPTPERDADELAHRLNREFPDLNWDLPTINVARAIFPAYCKN